MNDLAIVMSNNNKNINIEDTIKAISESDFKNVFIQWYDDDKDWEYTQYDQLKLSRELGLNIIFSHLGYKGINDMWLDNEDGDKLVERYIRNIKECSDNDIHLVIMHLANGFNPPECNKIGLERIKKIVEYAKSVGTQIAFENLKSNTHLEFILENIKDNSVGLCFDSGHYNAFAINNFNFDLFSRLLAVHLHDNHGVHDEHLIPYDGNLDWDFIISKLKESNFEGPLTFESAYGQQYQNIKISEFYERLYSVGEEFKEKVKRK